MKFCPFCGVQLQEDDSFCPNCGSALNEEPVADTNAEPSNTAAYTACTQQELTIERPVIDKGLASIIGYLSWVGFLIGMIAGDRKDPYARHHLSRALLMHIVFTCGYILLMIGTTLSAVGMYDYYSYYSRSVSGFSVVGTLLAIIASVAVIFTFVCWIIAIVRACKGTTKSVPLFDKFRLLK